MEFFVSHNQHIQTIAAPPSKSFAQRAILAAALCFNETQLKHIGTCEDVLHILKIAQDLGALAEQKGDDVVICGGVRAANPMLNAGESGLGIRLTTAICAALPGDFFLNGSGSLLKRPMTDFEQILPQLGVELKLNNGFLPITLKGKAHGGNLNINGNLSSQYLSGLLMALPLLEEDSIVEVSDLKSKPYIDITLAVLSNFGITIRHEKYKTFKIDGKQTYQSAGNLIIEGDYSGASVWMVYGAISNGISIEQLNPLSVQGDRQMLLALTAAGIRFNWQHTTLSILPGKVKPFSFDATECPDLFPALVVLAAAAQGKSTLKGARRLEHKESNRAVVLQHEFGKLGLKIELEDDYMFINGTGSLQSGTIDANNDHRIAMAGAVAAPLTNKGITILDAQSVAKSYPNFWDFFLRTK